MGSKDKFFSKEEIDKIKKYPQVELKIVEGAAHSLEIDEDYMKSLEILINVTKLYEDFVCRNKNAISKELKFFG